MGIKRKLTHDEWAVVRRRWEGDAQAGFDWVAAEVRGWLAVDITRQAVGDMARRRGWQKGGDPSAPLPLSHLAQDSKSLAQEPQAVSAAVAIVEKVKAEPVDLPQGEKPAGYAGTGRPSLYRPEYDAMIVAYFNKEPFTDHEVEQGNGVIKMQRMPTDPPMLAGFASSIGVTRETVNNWATDVGVDGRPRYPSFSDAYAHARELNESMLARGAILGIYESRFSVFVMKNMYGWQDQPARAVAVAPVSAEELERLYGSRMKAAYDRKLAVQAERAHLLEEG